MHNKHQNKCRNINWKKASKDKWEKFNMSLESKWTKMNEEGKNITSLQQLIIKTLETEIGTKTYNPNQK